MGCVDAFEILKNIQFDSDILRIWTFLVGHIKLLNHRDDNKSKLTSAMGSRSLAEILLIKYFVLDVTLQLDQPPPCPVFFS